MNIEVYVKGGQADKIAFLCCLIFGIVCFIVMKIKMWWEDKHER